MDWKVLSTVFTSVFIAELGDKTQLATMLFASAKETSKLTVFAGASAALIVFIPLWTIGLEIDRAFERSAAIHALFADPHIAKQAALSIFFSLYAIGSIVAGFGWRMAALRYFLPPCDCGMVE